MATYTGTTGNDFLVGGEGADVIRGSLGNDTVIGAGGNDTVYGGYGQDTIMGGAGNDRLYGGVDTDRDTFIFTDNDSVELDRVFQFGAEDFLEFSTPGSVLIDSITQRNGYTEVVWEHQGVESIIRMQGVLVNDLDAAQFRGVTFDSDVVFM